MPIIGYLEDKVDIKGMKEMFWRRGAISYCCNKRKAPNKRKAHQKLCALWDVI